MLPVPTQNSECRRNSRISLAFGVLSRDSIKEVVTTPRSPWQNAYVARLIGSIRRECLDHIIIFNEHHLRSILSRYFQYHHKTRTHLSLNKDCPQHRRIQPPPCRQYYCLPGGRWSASSIRTSRRVSYCGDRTGGPVSAWGAVPFYNRIARMQWRQNPCMVPRS